MISYALGNFGKHLKSRQIHYQSFRGPLPCLTSVVLGDTLDSRNSSFVFDRTTYLQFSRMHKEVYGSLVTIQYHAKCNTVSRKIWNRYNQVPHLT